jgi:hypothetical protein
MRYPSTLESFDSRPAVAPPVPRAAARSWIWLEAGSGRMLAALIAVLLLSNILLGFPGTMSNDSINQYAEATSGRFTDWHPPVMAWLWSKLRLVHEGPAPLFLVHLALYWAAFGAIADAMRRTGHRRIAVLVALAGAYPPFVFVNANVIKDVGMAVSLLACVAIVFWHRSQARRIPLAWAVAAGLLLAYGTLVRTNAVFALGPLLLYAFAPVRWLRNFRLMAATLLIALAAVPVSQLVNRVLFHPVQRDAISSLFLFDIIGVAAQEQDPALIEPRATMGLDALKRCYTPFWWDSFSAWGPCGKLVHRPDPDHATYGDGLAAQWLATVREHPRAYLVHRLKHFNSELFFAVPLKHLRLTPEYRTGDPQSNPYEVFSPSRVMFDLVRKNPTVWPVTWFVWGAALLAFLARRAPRPRVLLARVLVVSALAYTGAYFVVGVATDIRYHYWSILATAIATLVVLPLIARGWQRRSPVLTGGLAVVGLVVGIGLVTRLLDFQGWVF